MKSKIYSIRLLAVVLLTSAISIVTNAQDEYFREGFEGGPSYENGGIATVNPVSGGGPNNYYGIAGVSQFWFMHNAYRTSGTSCVASGYGAQHIRLLQNTTDTPYLISPVLDFGVGTVHLSRSANSVTPGAFTRRITIFTSNDTAVGIPYNGGAWEVAFRMGASENGCVDTAIIVNRPNAKRVAFIVSQAANADIDSIIITSTSPITPVKFTGISAATANGFTKVSWSNATETNTHSYIVERSVNGITFTKAGEVNAINARSYFWIDNAPVSGVSYYRIKAVDKDGALSYSSIVRISSLQKGSDFVIAPNVISGRTLNLQLNNIEKGSLSFSVSNNSGQIVYRSSLLNEGGSVTKTVQLPSSLTAGTYRVQLSTIAKTLTQTFVLQ